jgi:hypothetical protein
MMAMAGDIRCSFLLTREGFRAKATRRETAPRRSKERMRAFVFPNLSRVTRYWARTEANPRQKRRIINHKGKTGEIVIWFTLISFDAS